MAIEQSDEEPLEPDAVFEWRRDQLVVAGLSAFDAGCIAMSKADLHEVTAAINAGCPLDLVAAIFL